MLRSVGRAWQLLASASRSVSPAPPALPPAPSGSPVVNGREVTGGAGSENGGSRPRSRGGSGGDGLFPGTPASHFPWSLLLSLRGVQHEGLRCISHVEVVYFSGIVRKRQDSTAVSQAWRCRGRRTRADTALGSPGLCPAWIAGACPRGGPQPVVPVRGWRRVLSESESFERAQPTAAHPGEAAQKG